MCSSRSQFFATPPERKVFRCRALAKMTAAFVKGKKAGGIVRREKAKRPARGTPRLKPRACRRVDQWVLDGAGGGAGARNEHYVTDVDLIGMRVRPGLDSDVAVRLEGEIVVVVAGSAEPVVLDEGLVVFAANHPDDSAVAQVAQLSIAGWVEAFVHHGFSINSPAEFWMRSARQSYRVYDWQVYAVRQSSLSSFVTLGMQHGEIGLSGGISAEYTRSLSFGISGP